MHRQTRKNLLNLATGVAVAAAAVVVFLPAAYAAPGTITTNVNVRSGPGTNYAVVDVARGRYDVHASTACASRPSSSAATVRRSSRHRPPSSRPTTAGVPVRSGAA